jgi:hypothetical protein
VSEQTLTLPAAEFIAICRALSAAGPSFANKTVFLRFKPATLEIEGDMGGGVVETDGDFYAQVRVSSGTLARAVSLHRKRAPQGVRLRCILTELGEIRLPLSGLKAKFDS